ncbi:MAG TPA: S-formylglutathione hydrolase [Candidatus Competibacteraceae bacterium]|nr:S-formylglutathione hydrolase [Candidatus Competibacteraceae bacterium]HQA25570.1 S-formylglutathione hydrolase [Candidatus Competibacteraceae bacterium]HQD56518.1 S-formylglutathione hydrolase [Candidatus Competibacteraceae bacterium]
MEHIESIKEFGGWLNRYRHPSQTCQCDMTFSVYLPPAAAHGKVPAVYWLSGLTCTDDNFRVKAGAQRYAAELGLALVIPDTSPRGPDVPDVPERYDLGQGAGFYVNATQSPWSTHYHMYDYVTRELPKLVEENLPITDVRAISGHSMGGHGALICALKEPGRYRSVSAFAPICHPMACGWGQGCFKTYLGSQREDWVAYDAVRLIEEGAPAIALLIDQGTADEFLGQQLHPSSLERVCAARHFPLTLRWQEGYDHSYHFIATFIGEHLAYHAEALHRI